MPTIGQLPAALSVSDSDEIPIFQNGQTVAATRAQLLAGLQPALAVPANTLLGAIAPGIAAPGPISVGANLTLSNNSLSANAAPFDIVALPSTNLPNASDLIPLGQGGVNKAISYAQFMAGLPGLPAVPAGDMIALAAGATTARTLNEISANAVAIEDFGAAGDGVTDDSAALLAAIASGHEVRFGPKTYIINGECNITGISVSLRGVAGMTILQRGSQIRTGLSSTPAWLNITASQFFADGIIFDANRNVTINGWGVVIQPGCTAANITRCLFRNAMGTIYGWGLAINANDPAVTEHHIHDCEFTANAVDGMWVAASDAVSVTMCRAHDNTRHGLYIDSQDPQLILKIRKVHILGNNCWNNQSGIVVGNFNATNTEPGVYGNANPDILAGLVAHNNVHDNLNYGISISGRNILVTGNLCTNNSANGGAGAGILANTGYCAITNNMISGASPFGIDSGGAIFTNITGNYINGASIGLNAGGSQNCVLRGNYIQDCTNIAINIENVESDGRGNNFGIACNQLSITDNWIYYQPGGQGIIVRDGAQNILIAQNNVVANAGADPQASLLAFSDTLTIRNNMLNYATSWAANPQTIHGANTLLYPDIVDSVAVSQSSGLISSIMSAQGNTYTGQICFAKLTNNGQNYTNASVSFNGAGSGATGSVFLANGQVIGIAISNGGVGYGPGTTAIISGDGTGATATVQVGVPVPQDRMLSVQCGATTGFAAAGSSPAQANWTGSDITIEAGASIDWVGTNGGWQAARFNQSDYVSPNGDGSMTLRTQTGDMSLHPAGSGAVRLISDIEPTGCVSLIGRGTPNSNVTAPPGSSFRNLDGGVGATFWIKQTGNGNTGWVALA